MQVKVKTLKNFDHNLPLPHYATEGSVGADIYACLPDRYIILTPEQTVAVPTGIAVEIPDGYELQIRPRSGRTLKTPAHTILGTVDSDYRGEVKVILHNASRWSQSVSHGERIGQLVLSPIVKADFTASDELGDTERGQNGFGSTG